ncbi:MAG: peptidylprolyl isomerase [Gammaproteobacteria bacterium]|nr:peptidylprolyl isomerase [Gammaproteobacteria bacterium]
MLKFNSLCAFVALVAAPVVVADELSETGEFLDGVAAIVNEGVVLKSQLNEQLEAINARAAAQGIQLPPAEVLQEQILERLIIAEIQLQRAERIGLNVGDEMLNRAIGNIAQENGVPFEDMPRLLAEDGIDYGEFRRQLREEITISNLRTIEVGESINVSEREIEQCVADLEGNVVANSEYSLSHILLTMPDGASATEVKEVEDLANQVYAQIQNGADFREMAVRYSAGPTALEGGTLGWMQGQQVPTLFTDVLQDMGKGDVAPPIRAASSFHIVKVDDLRSAVERSQIDQTNVRHILIMPNEIIDDATAKQRLDEALAKIRAGEEDFGEQAKLLSDDPGSSNLGGELGWATAESFAPEFAQTIRDSEIGVISEPFRTQFGWHILEVLERRVYDNTEDLKQRNCSAKIRQGKMEEESQIWIQRLRDEAFVETRI